MTRANSTKRYVFSAEEISNILVNHVRKTYGLYPSESIDVSAQWNIRKVADENDITLVIKSSREDYTDE